MRCQSLQLGSLEYIVVKKPDFVFEFFNSIVCETEKTIILRLVMDMYAIYCITVTLEVVCQL